MMTTRWDSSGKVSGKRLTKREKLALLESYDTQMAQGDNRNVILGKIAEHIGGHTERQVERILAKAREYRSELNRHNEELSKAALKLAEILDWYYRQYNSSIKPEISSDFPYTTHAPKSPILNEQELSNLAAHLKDELPVLIPICEYPAACKQWSALGDKKWEIQIPSVTITADLILKLKLKGNLGKFSGKCPGCPNSL